jgi:hypothetical protein
MTTIRAKQQLNVSAWHGYGSIAIGLQEVQMHRRLRDGDQGSTGGPIANRTPG